MSTGLVIAMPMTAKGDETFLRGTSTVSETSTVESEYLTRKEAADYLRWRWRQRVSAQTLATYASDGKGPAYKVIPGSGVFYTKAHIDKWASSRLLPGKVA